MSNPSPLAEFEKGLHAIGYELKAPIYADLIARWEAYVKSLVSLPGAPAAGRRCSKTGEEYCLCTDCLRMATLVSTTGKAVAALSAPSQGADPETFKRWNGREFESCDPPAPGQLVLIAGTGQMAVYNPKDPVPAAPAAPVEAGDPKTIQEVMARAQAAADCTLPPGHGGECVPKAAAGAAPVDLEAANLWLHHDGQDRMTRAFADALISEVRTLRSRSATAPYMDAAAVAIASFSAYAEGAKEFCEGGNPPPHAIVLHHWHNSDSKRRLGPIDLVGG